MALVSVYDLDGKEHKRETVDARELEALGWTREPKPVVIETEIVIDSTADQEQAAEVVDAEIKKRGRKPKAE